MIEIVRNDTYKDIVLLVVAATVGLSILTINVFCKMMEAYEEDELGEGENQ